MTPTEKLDAVLRWFATSPFAQAPSNTDADIDHHMKEQYPELNTRTGSWGLHSILDKLVKEGHISFQDREISENGRMRKQRWYQITFDGEYFIQRNGYKGQKEREDALQNNQIKLQTDQFALAQAQVVAQINIIKLTRWLVFGAVGAVVIGTLQILWDIWKYLHSTH